MEAELGSMGKRGTGSEDGSGVEVEVVREGEEETLKYTVERRQMDESYVKYGMLDDGKTGYIRIKEFNNKTAEQFRSGLQDLKKEDAKVVREIIANYVERYLDADVLRKTYGEG